MDAVEIEQDTDGRWIAEALELLGAIFSGETREEAGQGAGRLRLARIAWRTDAAVVPGYAFWDGNLRKYRLRFEPPVELVRTGDAERDILENTQPWHGRFANACSGSPRW